MAHDRKSNDDIIINATEAALLVLALFFLVFCATSFLWAFSGETSVPLWVLTNHLPLLAMLGGSLWAARRYEGLLPPLNPAFDRVLFAIGAFCFGLVGGFSLHLWSPSRLEKALDPTFLNVWAFLWIGVLAPVIEEIYFRGVLQSALSRSMKTALAVPLTALLFTLAHLEFQGFLPWLVFGLVLGALMLSSRSLLVPVLCHVGWNLGSISMSIDLPVDGIVDWAGLVGFLLVAAGLFLRYFKARRG